MAEAAGENIASSPAPVAGQSGGKRSAWIAHIKSVAKAKGIKFGEAMKIASKSFKGGQLAARAGPMGGRRTKKKGRKGGALYGFGGDLADGGMAYGHSGDATYHGSTELTGAPAGAAPAAPAAGGRRRSRSRRSKSSKKGTARGRRR